MSFLSIAIFLLSAALLAVNADTASDVKLLKSQVKTLQNWRNLFSSYCGIQATGKCGPCVCREDHRIPDKYYCDCRNRPAQRDCLEHRRLEYTFNGIYTLTMNGNKSVSAYCDQKTDGGGWTVIQRRMDGSVNFYRRWQEYKEGFGQLHREFWFGNENIHLLTAQAASSGSEAMVQLKVRGYGNTVYTDRYKFIQVDSEQKSYLLHVKKSSGNFGPSYFTSYNNGMKFSTSDRDNDRSSSYNCARDTQYTGWWINGSGNSCTSSGYRYTNLNGPYDEYRTRTWYKRICWGGSGHPSFTEMKIRRL